MNTMFVRTGYCLLLFSLLIACSKSDVEPANPPVPAPPPEVPITMKLKPETRPVGNAVDGYYVGLPSDYTLTTKRYPVLIYIPGAGQFGNGSIDLPLLLKDGPAQLIDEGRFPGTFTVNGARESMIVFTPQLKWWPSTYSIDACIEFVKSEFRVDSTRIYLSGLSMGGILTCDLAGETPRKLAAIVPMAGVSIDYASSSKCQQIAANQLPVWAFHCQDDAQIGVQMATGFVAKINSYQPVIPPRLTIWPTGGHDAWTRALDPNYRENGKNIYEWMLSHHR
jgi:hypothetical protein